eukprot:6490134-Amphidinium_carterae.1
MHAFIVLSSRKKGKVATEEWMRLLLVGPNDTSRANSHTRINALPMNQRPRPRLHDMCGLTLSIQQERTPRVHEENLAWALLKLAWMAILVEVLGETAVCCEISQEWACLRRSLTRPSGG